MVKLEELLTSYRIGIIVEDEEYACFLAWAKENGCLWWDGRIIQPSLDMPDKTTKMIVITEDKLIHHPHGFIAYYSTVKIPKYYFKDISTGIIKDALVTEKDEKRQ